jgi:transcriptional regulator with XRE-family HTH domain
VNRLRANLAALLDRFRLNQQQLADAAGLRQSTISRMLSPNAPDPQAATVQRVASVFGVTVDALLNSTDPTAHATAPTLSRSARVQEVIHAYAVEAVEDGAPAPATHAAIEHMDFQISAGDGAALPVFAETKYPMLYRLDWFYRHHAKPENVKSMGVRGASMERTLFDGDRIAVHIADRTVINDAVFALVLDGEAVVKRLFRNGPRGLRIVSDNDDKQRYPDVTVTAEELDDRVQILGRVIDKSGAGGL